MTANFIAIMFGVVALTVASFLGAALSSLYKRVAALEAALARVLQDRRDSL